MSFSIRTAASQAKKAARQIARLAAVEKNALLHRIADNLIEQTQKILQANELYLMPGLGFDS